MINPQYGEHQRTGPGATVMIQIVISALIWAMLMFESSQLAFVVVLYCKITLIPVCHLTQKKSYRECGCRLLEVYL
jgi:hypothetical protein